MGPLLPGQEGPLWILSALILLPSLWMTASRGRTRPEPALLFFVAILLVMAELEYRLFIVLFRPHDQATMALYALRTYPRYQPYRPHPFLQFTGMPSVRLQGDRSHPVSYRFNNFGFNDRDFTYEKGEGVIRVAALGGSTTASGFPAMMERYLESASKDREVRYEVMNFGQGWYTSAHSLVNFSLNVLDFSPDYVVIHHAWNDNVARNIRSGFRGDYSHALKAYESPVIPDRFLVRASVIYRALKFRNPERRPAWAFLDSATTILDRPLVEEKWKNRAELEPYRRNIRSIVDLAAARGIRVILTTQPRSENPALPFFDGAEGIDQCNEVMREVHRAAGGRSVLVDLDAEMTGVMEGVFVDLAHVNDEGRKYKARRIGRAILSDFESGAPARPER